MIQIVELEVSEFRGIRSLNLKLDAKSFVVHGPNGSGKSGIVDAIGFALTGTIARLTGVGTAGLSVLKHGPHVHKRDDPASAWVKLTFRDKASGQIGTVVRTVKSPNAIKLTPDTPELRAAIAAVAAHPELTLSRREIIKFILSEPGRRAAEVQALLQLAALDSQRRALRSAVTKVSQNKSTTESALNGAQESVARHLDIPKLLPSEVLRTINTHRSVLSLQEIDTLTLDTDFKEGIDETVDETHFDKPSALRDIGAANDLRSNPVQLDADLNSLRSAMTEFGNDPTILDSLAHRSFLEVGLEIVAESGTCPLCDIEWPSPERLRLHLQQKIQVSAGVARREQGLRTAAANVVTSIRAERDVVKPVHALAIAWGSPESQAVLQAWDDQLLAVETQLGTISGIVAQRDAIEAGLLSPPPELNRELTSLAQAIGAKPDTSAKAAARTFLLVAAERWTQQRNAKAAHDVAAAAHELAERFYRAYCAVADVALTDLYHEVEGRFSKFYQQINSDDESAFKAELEPSAGSLDLRVDFHGLGMYPPSAYHSEGHQDGMGVCLYLALVENLLGSDFTFSVLDDVVMSVDSNHRRQFCELLKTEFPDVQFIITTHDEVWAKQMQTAGLIQKQSQVRFHGWHVDTGPTAQQGTDFWDRIQADLDNDDVESAAHKLRRGLEAELPELAESLRARVTYRGDAKYELGELVNAVKGRHSDWLKRAASSANSWNNESAKKRVSELKDARAEVMMAQAEETWAINALVHYNEWVSMTKADFAPVVQAWREFLQLFRCDNSDCMSWIEVGGYPGHEDVLRCRCGAYMLNLLTKSNS